MKHILKSMIHPKRIYSIILGVLFIASSLLVIFLDLTDRPIAYVSYLLSSYGLYLLIIETVVPLVKMIKRWMRRNPHIDRYYTDAEFKTRVKLYSGSAFNILYAIFKLTVGAWFHSVWFIAIGFYYISLCAIKLFMIKNDIQILKSGKRMVLREWQIYRTVGWMLFLLNIALSGMFIQVIRNGKSYYYPGFIIFGMAFYAFYRIITAVINLLKGRKNRSPVFSAVKTLDFIFAVVAMYTLQTAMLSTFGDGTGKYDVVFNTAGGVVTSALINGIVILMLIRANRKVKHDMR